MIDDILEIILEIVLDGAVEAAGSKKVPLPIRILLAGLILLFGLGIIGLILWTGIGTYNLVLILLSVVLLIAFVCLLIISFRRYQNKRRE